MAGSGVKCTVQAGRMLCFLKRQNGNVATPAQYHGCEELRKHKIQCGDWQSGMGQGKDPIAGTGINKSIILLRNSDKRIS